jgi:hypothetical protein
MPVVWGVIGKFYYIESRGEGGFVFPRFSWWCIS